MLDTIARVACNGDVSGIETATLEAVISTIARIPDVRYVDARYSDIRDTSVRIRNEDVDSISNERIEAVGVRVLSGNGWGFAGTTEASIDALRRCAERALSSARAAHLAMNEPVRLADAQPARGLWQSPWVIDPDQIPVSSRIDELREATASALGDDRILQALAVSRSRHHLRRFASSDGGATEQRWVESGAGLEITAGNGNEIQRRSYPDSSDGDTQSAGWEYVRSLDLAGNAGRVRDEALQLLEAPRVTPGRADVLILSSQMALQVHESCGHPVELDRILGWELSLAGGSFLTIEDVGKLRYGSPLVNIVADATLPGALGSFGWDDEGVPAQRTSLVTDGVLTGLLTGRDTAPFLDTASRSNATVRGESAAHLPIIRMTNINLEPGSSSLGEMVSSVRRGWLLDTNKSWSIDDVRLDFQFSCEAAWEIRDGKVGALHRNPVYAGRTPDFWNRCAAVGDLATWRLWGLTNCGKGDPMQTMRVGHGAPAALFRDVEVG